MHAEVSLFCNEVTLKKFSVQHNTDLKEYTEEKTQILCKIEI